MPRYFTFDRRKTNVAFPPSSKSAWWYRAYHQVFSEVPSTKNANPSSELTVLRSAQCLFSQSFTIRKHQVFETFCPSPKHKSRISNRLCSCFIWLKVRKRKKVKDIVAKHVHFKTFTLCASLTPSGFNFGVLLVLGILSREGILVYLDNETVKSIFSLSIVIPMTWNVPLHRRRCFE